MTAIIKTRSFDAPPITRAGLVLPGLGHLLVGEWIVGGGLLSMVVLLGWALVGTLRHGMGPIDVLPSLGLLVAATAWQLGGLAAYRTLAPKVVDDPDRERWLIPGLLFAYASLAVLSLTVGMSALSPMQWVDTIHPAIAACTFVPVASLVVHTAYRRAWPQHLSDEAYNSNSAVFLRTFRRNRTGMIGLFGMVFLITTTLVTPMLTGIDPNAIDVGAPNLAPGFAYLMGTDEYGRDVFTRVLYGGRISMSIGFIAASIAATIGTTIGAIAAFFGGWIDRGLMYIVDMLLSLPRLVLLLAIVGIFRLTGVYAIFLIVVILGLTGWMGVSRIVRSQVLSLREQDFIQAARALGMSNTRIVFRHLIPNALAPVIVYVTLAIGSTMLAEAGLSFLGLGVQPPTSTWGTMVNDGREPLRLAPWIATFPGLAIVAAVMSFNLFGDGLRDALDPKMRGQ